MCGKLNQTMRLLMSWVIEVWCWARMAGNSCHKVCNLCRTVFFWILGRNPFLSAACSDGWNSDKGHPHLQSLFCVCLGVLELEKTWSQSFGKQSPKYPNPSLQKTTREHIGHAHKTFCQELRQRCAEETGGAPRKWWTFGSSNRPQRPRSPCSTPEGYKSLQERVSSRLTSRCCESGVKNHRLAISPCNDISQKINMKPETEPLKKVWRRRFWLWDSTKTMENAVPSSVPGSRACSSSYIKKSNNVVKGIKHSWRRTLTKLNGVCIYTHCIYLYKLIYIYIHVIYKHVCMYRL